MAFTSRTCSPNTGQRPLLNLHLNLSHQSIYALGYNISLTSRSNNTTVINVFNSSHNFRFASFPDYYRIFTFCKYVPFKYGRLSQNRKSTVARHLQESMAAAVPYRKVSIPDLRKKELSYNLNIQRSGIYILIYM